MKKNDSRRKLLKSIAAGSGAVVAGKALPESWSKPVVDAVMLPAHASTTDDTGSGGPEVTTPAPLPTSYNHNLEFIQQQTQNSPLENVLSVLVQDAYACCAATVGSMCVHTSNAPAFTAEVLVSDGSASAYFTGGGTIGSTGETLDFKGGCDDFGDVRIVIASNDENGAVYTVTTNNGGKAASGTAPPGQTCPVDPGDCESDIRLKTNIEELSTSREGFNLYKFQYLSDADENTYVGVMAQDVMSKHPEAIVQNESGFYMVRYAQLGLKMVTLDEWELEGPDSVELKH